MRTREKIRSYNRELRKTTGIYDEIQFNVDCLKNGGLEKHLTPQHESEFFEFAYHIGKVIKLLEYWEITRGGR
tara:strand:+ start:204 stop:422 length:219 start_codon:yes stop_codon:yes gene_type:complete